EKPAVKLTFGTTDKGVVHVLREVGGERTVVDVPDKLLGLVEQGELAFLDRTLPSFSESAEVTKLVIVRSGETYELTRDKDAAGAAVWKINQPPALAGRTADSGKVDQVLADLRGLHTKRLVAEKAMPDALKKY